MTEQRDMLAQTADRLFGELMETGISNEPGNDLSGPWLRIEELGLLDLFQPESAGGFGGCWADAVVVFNLLGLHALPLPVGETIIGRKLLGEADIALPSGILTLAECADAVFAADSTGGVVFSGTLLDVPWGAQAQHVLVAAHAEGRDYLVLLARHGAADIATHSNDAFEPRDTIRFEGASVVNRVDSRGAPNSLFSQAALLRTSQIAGALEKILALSVDYANQREQFGRPLSKFQALQHQLALLAEEAAAVKCAAMAAALAQDKKDSRFEIAASKLRANQSVGEATSIAHQTHGAIGITREHQLHQWTQRLWSWRSEFGNDRHWSNILGKIVLSEGADNFWGNLTSRSDS